MDNLIVNSALEFLRRKWKHREWIIESTLEGKDYIVFWYTSAEYERTKDTQYLVVGEGPLVFNKKTNEFFFAGSITPITNFIEEEIVKNHRNSRGYPL